MLQRRNRPAYRTLKRQFQLDDEAIEDIKTEIIKAQRLALAEELGMRPLQAHCHCGLGLSDAQIGRRQEARVALSAAIALYRSMEMTFWLPQVEVALPDVGGHRVRESTVGMAPGSR